MSALPRPPEPIPGLVIARPNRRAPMLQKARNLRAAIERARADGNQQLLEIWELDYRLHCEAYLIKESEL